MHPTRQSVRSSLGEMPSGKRRPPGAAASRREAAREWALIAGCLAVFAALAWLASLAFAFVPWGFVLAVMIGAGVAAIPLGGIGLGVLAMVAGGLFFGPFGVLVGAVLTVALVIRAK